MLLFIDTIQTYLFLQFKLYNFNDKVLFTKNCIVIVTQVFVKVFALHSSISLNGDAQYFSKYKQNYPELLGFLQIIAHEFAIFMI